MDDSKAQKITELLWAADEGRLEELDCPDCHEPTVSVWFTHPMEGEYRTWFICGECSFHIRAHNTGRPPHYSEERVSEKLENYDEHLLSTAKFKRPKRVKE